MKANKLTDCVYEDYVSYDTAKMLESKGFGEDCFCPMVYRYLNKESYDRISMDEATINGVFRKYLTNCPSLNQVRRWLQEKYSVYMNITTVWESVSKAPKFIAEFEYKTNEGKYKNVAISDATNSHLRFDSYENAFDACLSKIFECMDKKEYFKNLIEVYRQDGSVRKVSIMKDRATGKFCFLNLTTMHVCQCRFDTFEDAIQDLEKREDVKRYSINFIDDEKSIREPEKLFREYSE